VSITDEDAEVGEDSGDGCKTVAAGSSAIGVRGAAYLLSREFEASGLGVAAG
jgi:hypothetical protein